MKSTLMCQSSNEYQGVSSHTTGRSSVSSRLRSASYKLPLAQLPYEIISQILRFAYHSLMNVEFQLSIPVSWLIATAQTCRSFLEPALSLLYEIPPLNSLEKPHKLVQLLRQPSAVLLTDYKRKIKCLQIQAEQTLAYSAPRVGKFSIVQLIELLPCLSAIDISNAHDKPPFRSVTQAGRWSYPLEMFQTMERCRINLKSWRWNGEMSKSVIFHVNEIHNSTPFQNLRHLSLSHFKLLDDPSMMSRNSRNEMLFSNLAPLSQLKSISFESCSSEGWDSLLRLQCELVSLRIINCHDFDAQSLACILQSLGKHLKSLTVSHNQSLSLDFSSELATCCPQLQALVMDCILYSKHITHMHSSNPSYDTLLTPGVVPTWPSCLQKIELLHLRKWSHEAAEVLFSSLKVSAQSLTQLRHLTIRVMLDISWRERAQFRQKWVESMTATFLRPTRPSTAVTNVVQMDRKPRQRSVQTFKSYNIPIIDRKHQQTSYGFCDSVSISIDNLHPTEFKFSEADFVD